MNKWQVGERVVMTHDSAAVAFLKEGDVYREGDTATVIEQGGLGGNYDRDKWQHVRFDTARLDEDAYEWYADVEHMAPLGSTEVTN